MGKPYLVILGGIGDTGRNSYTLLKNELKKYFEIVKVVYPGFGNIPIPKEATMVRDIKIIKQQIKSLTPEKNREIVIFSHSIGTAYAFELCYPNDLNIKALIATNPFTVKSKNIYKSVINGWIERKKLGKWLKENNIPPEFRLFGLNSIKNIPAYLRTAKIFKNLRLKADLPNLNIPVLALIGDNDKLVPKATQMHDLDLIPNLQIEHFNEEHYFVHTQAPKVAKLIRKFAKSNGITL